MRKIKLMALLLAALMIVTAFAGCASVKQEEFDAVEDRVSAIEDLLKGQQDIISDLAGKVDANGNQEILDAIDSVKNDLEEKIESVNNRVEAVEKQEPTAGTTVTDATKAKQAEALASIEVQKATFSKNADEYDEATYAAITAAFGTAQAEVTAATTEAGVKAAMDKLAAALDTYKTYAMKLYDYYVALLGNVNEDAEELVDEVLDFIEVIDEVYEDLDEDEKIEELEYLVSEGTTAAKNVYLDVYSSVVALCNIFTKTSGEYDVEYVNAKGKVVSDEFWTVSGFKKAAKALDKKIQDKVGDEILFSDLSKTFGKDENGDDITYSAMLDALQKEYEDFIKDATLIGGDKLADLVTKADIIADAEATVEALYEAEDAYKGLNGRGKNGLKNYTDLATKVGLTFLDKDGDTVWYDEYYDEEITAVLEAWIEEYDLSEDNVKAIVGEAKYNSYLADAHKVALIAAAYEKFADEIVPAINDINKLSAGSADAVQEYKDLKDAIEELAVLQEADAKNDNDLLKPEIILSNAAFLEFVEESEILKVSDLAIKEMQNLNDEKAAAADKARFAKFAANFTGDSPKATANKLGNAFIELFVFVEDAKHIARADGFKYLDNYANVEDETITLDDKDTEDTSDDVTSTLTAPELYYFFAKEYTAAETEADKINEVIEELVELVEDKKIGTNEDFIALAGEYINATNKAIDSKWTFESADGKYSVKAGNNVYVAIEDAIDYEEFTGIVQVTTKIGSKSYTTLTIDFFNNKYPVFVDLIDVDEFEAAQKTLEARIVELFADIDELETLVEKINYVRANAYEYVDENNNGKYDDGEETETKILQYTVSLNEKAAVDNAVAIYDNWVYNGGNEKLAIFTELVNENTEKVYGGVYVMKGFDNAAEVTTVLTTLRALEKNIASLVSAANKFINGVKHVEAVEACNSITVNTTGSELFGAADINYYALTKYTKSGTDATNLVHGDWTWIYSNSDINGALGSTTKTFSVTKDKEYGSSAMKFFTSHGKENALTKGEMIKHMVGYYDAFYGQNISYVAASNNDYENADKVYYVNNEYAAYKAFDDKVAAYEKFDLLAAKAVCINVAKGDASYEGETFKRQVIAAKTLGELGNVIGNYNTVVKDAKYAIKISHFNEMSIYEFNFLEYVAPVVATPAE